MAQLTGFSLAQHLTKDNFSSTQSQREGNVPPRKRRSTRKYCNRLIELYNKTALTQDQIVVHLNNEFHFGLTLPKLKKDVNYLGLRRNRRITQTRSREPERKTSTEVVSPIATNDENDNDLGDFELDSRLSIDLENVQFSPHPYIDNSNTAKEIPVGLRLLGSAFSNSDDHALENLKYIDPALLFNTSELGNFAGDIYDDLPWLSPRSNSPETHTTPSNTSQITIFEGNESLFDSILEEPSNSKGLNDEDFLDFDHIDPQFRHLDAIHQGWSE